jgi:hypothetical protein
VRAQEEPEVPSGKKSIFSIGFSSLDFPNGLPSLDWGFDYLAEKDSRNYFVEVKTNNARLRSYQSARYMLLRHQARLQGLQTRPMKTFQSRYFRFRGRMRARKMIMKSKEFGFIPMVVRPRFSIIARFKDVTT